MAAMLTIDEAIDAILEQAWPVSASWLPCSQAVGCVLAEDVAADLDLPPFDKSVVDGYAVRVGDLDLGDRLSLGEVITAGKVPSRPLAPREAAVIMTGAPVPAGADAVVMHEHTRASAADVWIEERKVRAGQNILARGREMRAGEIVLTTGSILNPARLGLLASVGRTMVKAVTPRVVVVPTGDELVPPDQVPGPGQIRNSNAVMLQALALAEGARAESLPIARDEPDSLLPGLKAGLDSDLLIVTGGVSAGQKDLVPAAFDELGVRRIFHKVRLKPGKPVWFGVGPPRGELRGALVFGLPGNPVSSLVAFLLFIKPALTVMSGKPEPRPKPQKARLLGSFTHRGDRPTYFPSRKVDGPQGLGIEPLAWSGSADLRTAALADGFAVFGAGERDYAAGEIVDFLAMR
jgi:molybdopterin molybdotransferase